MKECRVLIVDDEPAVVENLAAVLEGLDDYSVDIYRAYSAENAIDILRGGNMDLVVCDIEMPGTNGLELQKKVRKLWPNCPVAFLTAYSRFDYIYEAMQNHVAQFILKSESEAVIRERIIDLLESITRPVPIRQESKTDDTAIFQSNRSFPAALLCREDYAESVRELLRCGFYQEEDQFCIVLCKMSEERFAGILLELMDYFLSGIVVCARRQYDEKNAMHVFLLQLKTSTVITPVVQLSCMLEKIQDAFSCHCHAAIAMLLEPFQLSRLLPAQAFQAALSQISRIACRTGENILYTHEGNNVDISAHAFNDLSQDIIKWVCAYIEEHISEDISLLRLSHLTGYNAQYLSGLFRSIQGVTISKYISQVRIRWVKELIVDDRLSLSDIIRKVGICSRSYFNRFVKKETGLTPHELRYSLLHRPPGPPNAPE